MIAGTTVAFTPLLPLPVLLALVVLAAGVVGLALYRRARGSWLRALFAAILLLALANPTLVHEQRQTRPDVALLVVDKSRSQEVGDRAQRTEEARQALSTTLSTLRDLEVRTVTLDRARPGDPDIEGGTRLYGALTRALAELPRQRYAGAIMITDGQVHDAPAGAAAAAASGPLHVLLTGKRKEADRRIAITQAPRYGIVGKPLQLRLRVDDGAVPPGTLVEVTLRRDGDAAGEQHMLVPTGREHTVPFTLDRRGHAVLELSVAPGPQELSLANNHAVASISGVRDRLRVLLVTGEPHAGERVWRSLLKSDPSVDLVHFTILRPPEKHDGTPINELSLISFPVRQLFEIKLEEFDLVIFDRYKRRGVLPFPYLTNIAEYVQQGGALLEAVGPTFATPLSLFNTPLGEVLPGRPTGRVYETPYRAYVTTIGHRHPVTTGLPGANPSPDARTANARAADGAKPNEATWGRWFRQIAVEPVRGEVLMGGVNGAPLLILDRVGEGRVAQIMSDQMWLWARGYEGGGPQAELLRRVAHWLMKEPDLEENDLRAEVRGGQLYVQRRSLHPVDRPVAMTSPLGDSQTLTLQETAPGVEEGTQSIDEPGIYRITDGERTTLAAAGPPNPLELAELVGTEDKLKPVVEATGGGMVWLADDGVPSVRRVRADGQTAGSGWIGLVANRDYEVTGITRLPLLPALLLLTAALAAIALAWYREGR